MMRNLLIFLVSTICCLDPALGETNSLSVYAVGVNQGAGVYLGDGLVLSVAHVAGRGIFINPRIAIAGQQLSATIVKESPFEALDLALLSFDETGLPVSLRLRRLPLCQGRPWPGEQVISLLGTTSVRSYILSPLLLPRGTRRFSTVIRDVATTGNSGSGLFDANRQCLLGVMSRKISQVRVQKNTGQKITTDLAKYFVPASTISAFVPERYHLKLESNPPQQFGYGQ